MLLPFFESMLQNLKSELHQIENQNLNFTEELRESLNRVQFYLQSLKEKVMIESFADDEAEIYFFKKVKPQFYAFKIFLVDKFNIERNIQSRSKESLDNFLKAELQFIDRYIATNAFYYNYFDFDMDNLDKEYFLRHGNKAIVYTFEVPEFSPEFSTSLDYLYAKFLANRKLKEWINHKINLTVNNFKAEAFTKETQSLMKWTGETINLVEIAYGIWLTGQVNNGNSSISEIIRWLEDVLGVHIGDPHRRWVEIARRKRSSPTKHLDNMVEMVMKRIDGELAVKD